MVEKNGKRNQPLDPWHAADLHLGLAFPGPDSLPALGAPLDANQKKRPWLDGHHTHTQEKKKRLALLGFQYGNKKQKGTPQPKSANPCFRSRKACTKLSGDAMVHTAAQMPSGHGKSLVAVGPSAKSLTSVGPIRKIMSGSTS